MADEDNMDKVKHQKDVPQGAQVLYLGRYVDKETFCAFVYGKLNHERLANSYAEYTALVSSGLWFSTKEEALSKKGKKEKSGEPEIEENQDAEALAKIKEIKAKMSVE
jgi:hypothetical protein